MTTTWNEQERRCDFSKPLVIEHNTRSRERETSKRGVVRAFRCDDDTVLWTRPMNSLFHVGCARENNNHLEREFTEEVLQIQFRRKAEEPHTCLQWDC